MLPDPITSTPTVIDRESLKAIMRDVIVEIVQPELLKPLVNAAVAERMELTRQQISAIDGAQHTSFERFENSATRMQDSADKFQDTARTVMESIGTLRATDIAQQQDISEIKESIRQIVVWKETVDKVLQNMDSKYDNLRTDIHGSLTDTNRKSIFSGIEGLGVKIDKMKDSLNARQDVMESKLEVHDEFIVKRKAIESWVITFTKGLWKKQTTRWALALGLPVISGLFLAAADPRIADGIAKFISLVVQGK